MDSMMSSASMDSMMSAMSTMSSRMSSMSMAMSGMSAMSTAMPTSTMGSMTMAMSTASASHTHSGGSMGGMHGGGMGGMDMGGGDKCKISMIWNWNTIDSCFLSNGWHVKTSGQFAGTCIGVFLWVVFLCFLSRLRRQLDSYIMSNGLRKFTREQEQQGLRDSNSHLEPPHTDNLACTEEPLGCNSEMLRESTTKMNSSSSSHPLDRLRLFSGSTQFGSYRPNIFEQIVRALLFGFEYSITWLVALIMMSYNGYVIISACLGATLGYLIVNWEKMKPMGNEPYTAQPVCC